MEFPLHQQIQYKQQSWSSLNYSCNYGTNGAHLGQVGPRYFRLFGVPHVLRHAGVILCLVDCMAWNRLRLQSRNRNYTQIQNFTQRSVNRKKKSNQVLPNHTTARGVARSGSDDGWEVRGGAGRPSAAGPSTAELVGRPRRRGWLSVARESWWNGDGRGGAGTPRSAVLGAWRRSALRAAPGGGAARRCGRALGGGAALAIFHGWREESAGRK